MTKNPATPRKDPDMNSAECTTLRLRTTPSARRASSRLRRRTRPSSRLFLLGSFLRVLARSRLGGLLLFHGGLGVYGGVDGTLAELTRELQPIVGLRLELLGVVDAVHRTDLDAQ